MKKITLFLLITVLNTYFSVSQDYDLLDLIHKNQTKIESSYESLSFTNDNNTLEITDASGCSESVSMQIETFVPGATCTDSQTFCSPTAPYVFPNNSEAPSLGQQSCLFITPNPTWYYLSIEEAGDLEFEIKQSTGGLDGEGNAVGTVLDVDFVAWGPFDSWDIDNCESLDDCNGIPGCINNTNPNSQFPFPGGTNVVDCSFDASPVETFTIPNAQVGEVYAVLITNFSNQNGFISLQQVNSEDDNSGITNCSFLFEPNACLGESVFLEIPNPTTALINWFELDDNGEFQSIDVNDPFAFEVSENGIYLAETFDSTGASLGDFEYEIFIYNRQFPEPLQNVIEECINEIPEAYTHDLSVYDFEFLQIENSEDLEITYKDAENIIIENPSTYEPNNGDNIINIEIKNTETEDCSTFTSINLKFTFLNFEETVNKIDEIEECIDPETGVASFNLEELKVDILGGEQNIDSFSVSYFDENGSIIDELENYMQAMNQLISVLIESNLNPGCTTSFEMNLIVLEENHPNCNLNIENYKQLDFSVYPNPTKGKINLESSHKIQKLSIYDIKGKLIKILNQTQITEINLSNLPNGLYFLTVESDGLKQIMRVIKEN